MMEISTLPCIVIECMQRESLCTGQEAHQAVAYPGFSSMKQLGVFAPPPHPTWMGGWSIAVSCPRTQLNVPGLEPGPLNLYILEPEQV